MSTTTAIAALGAPTALSVGMAPAVAMDMTYLAMAGSLGLVMQNAAANQQRGQVLSSAAMAQVIALIIAKGAAPSS
ncbi:MAG: RebB family R body protein [Caulobacteraceae bacterium]